MADTDAPVIDPETDEDADEQEPGYSPEAPPDGEEPEAKMALDEFTLTSPVLAQFSASVKLAAIAALKVWLVQREHTPASRAYTRTQWDDYVQRMLSYAS